MELIKYEAAKTALAEYKTVDEVKDFRDKAVAIEAYAKQANDYDLERDAAVARVRAERRCGELLRDTDKAKGNQHVNSAKSNGATEQNKTLAQMGITKDQSSQWRKLAEVPEKEFQDAVNASLKSSGTINASRLLKNQEPNRAKSRIDELSLWWWGRLIDMEKNGFDKSINEVVSGMTDAMGGDAARIIPKLRGWINDYTN